MRAAFVREAHQTGRQPPRDVEEVELLDMGGQPTQLPGDRREQRVAYAGLGRDQLPEPVARQDDGLGRAERRRAG